MTMLAAPVGLEATMLSKDRASLTMKEYRCDSKKRKEEFHRRVRAEGLQPEIRGVVIRHPRIDMTQEKGTSRSLARRIDDYYGSIGGFFDPEMHYPPVMLDSWSKEYMQNAQGIYYHDHCSPNLVTCNRKIWVPNLHDFDWNDPEEKNRRRRARILKSHAVDNGKWKKSEYAWEADAWSDVFGQMRRDDCLALDKRDISIRIPETAPILCQLTGKTTTEKRIPDATFGLATYEEDDIRLQSPELAKEFLEKLLLHPKCGLLSDPKWGETDLAFPFAVYEAKSWAGDAKEARRQACLAAAGYLDLLDDLVRRPGPVGTLRPYQTPTSHNFQVFALTSFGAHWHLLVGYKRPRRSHQDEEGCPEIFKEHGGKDGLSKDVYIFQKVWSGQVTHEKEAWELLSLIDQIHLWSITEYRSFVVEHLRPWHEFCQKNYLFDWDGIYDCSDDRKMIRSCQNEDDSNDFNNLALPKWVDFVDERTKQRIRTRAAESFDAALRDYRREKGKCRSYADYPLVCLLPNEDDSEDQPMANDDDEDEIPLPPLPPLDPSSRHDRGSHLSALCKASFTSSEAFLDHFRESHGINKEDMAYIENLILSDPREEDLVVPLATRPKFKPTDVAVAGDGDSNSSSSGDDDAIRTPLTPVLTPERDISNHHVMIMSDDLVQDFVLFDEDDDEAFDESPRPIKRVRMV